MKELLLLVLLRGSLLQKDNLNTLKHVLPKTWNFQKTKNFGYLLWRNIHIRNTCSVKTTSYWCKISSFTCLLVAFVSHHVNCDWYLISEVLLKFLLVWLLALFCMPLVITLYTMQQTANYFSNFFQNQNSIT